MKTTFKIWKRNREILSSFLEDYSIEELNKVPDGFNNNLIWNIAHVLAVQQKLAYKTSKLESNIPNSYFLTYNTGEKPTSQLREVEIQDIKRLLKNTIEQTIEDYNNQKFNNFHELTTSTGFHLANIEEALEFNNYHEALHLGLMFNIRKFI